MFSTTLDTYQNSLLSRTQLAFPKEAHKMVPRLEAQFLTFLARVTRAKVILEIGCFTGYSTLALAYGIRHREKKGAKLITIDKDPLGAVLAKKHVELAGVQKIVEFKIGDALEIIEGLNNDIKFDMIFLDANKKGYLDYYNTIMNKDLLAKNGYIVCDNVLFRGYVCAFSDPYVRFADLHTSDGPVPPEHKHIARYMHRFNDAVQKDQRVENLILPVFDGIMLIWKKKIAPVEVEYLEKYKRLTEMEEIKEKEIINSKSADQMGQGTVNQRLIYRERKTRGIKGGGGIRNQGFQYRGGRN